ncbi:MAG: hypothetical protein P1U58_04850 [Verrucomicrobiales bacterium]|nr:hypothetical protein [Verrucomicrobiales bacterium]
MRYSVLLTILVSIALTSANAQVKKGGLFGFGADDDQISGDLFPTTPGVTADPPNVTFTPVKNEDDTIFRGGEPAEIDAVSYVIENGEKVEKKVEPKKKGFFAFGKKAEKEVTDAIEPIPAQSYPQPTNVIPVPAEVSEAPAVVENVVEESSEAIMEAVNTPPVIEEKKKSGGLFSFFGKKSEEIPDTPAFAMDDEVVAVQEAIPTANPYQAPATIVEAAPAEASVVADPVPLVATVEPQAKPEKQGFSLTNPLAKIRGQKEEKTIDLTGAETIIQNGEIVDAADDIVESNRVEMDQGDRQPPRIVNGVKTYSSWDDVDARSVSAADKILNQIR